MGSNDKNDEVVFFFSGHGTNGIVADGIVAGEDDGEYIDEGIVVYDSDGKRDGDGPLIGVESLHVRPRPQSFSDLVPGFLVREEGLGGRDRYSECLAESHSRH